MFGIFRRKRSFSPEAKFALVGAVSEMLLALHSATGKRSIEDDGGKINQEALGYILVSSKLGLRTSAATRSTLLLARP